MSRPLSWSLQRWAVEVELRECFSGNVAMWGDICTVLGVLRKELPLTPHFPTKYNTARCPHYNSISIPNARTIIQGGHLEHHVQRGLPSKHANFVDWRTGQQAAGTHSADETNVRC